jgi:hypothetical protein
MPGLVVADQLLTGVSADHLARGLPALGAATSVESVTGR